MNEPTKKHGGARAGAGRPPNEPVILPPMPATSDPLEFLQQVMSNPVNDARLRIAAAVALMPYIHSKKDTGKKDEAQQAAKRAGAGKFGASAPPVRLVK